MNHTITAALSGSAGKDFAGTAYARVDIDAPSERLTGLRKPEEPKGIAANGGR
ncbi:MULTISPECIES: hypothetical protein [unclassified Neisseria]|uniref:hypothetical protein n=1 Tax=unclassified Neisseria TaxID=2623750 RepID=UPI00142FB753|nr:MULTISPECIES: hypothetical protein [unclassified Neisseria]MBF0802837.1 hypothetical protein [Neisseria sp. 19428wB4_WF04]